MPPGELSTKLRSIANGHEALEGLVKEGMDVLNYSFYSGHRRHICIERGTLLNVLNNMCYSVLERTSVNFDSQLGILVATNVESALFLQRAGSRACFSTKTLRAPIRVEVSGFRTWHGGGLNNFNQQGLMNPTLNVGTGVVSSNI